MRQHLADSEDVRAERDLKGRKRVPKAMERDVLLDARLPQPFLQRMLDHRTFQPTENPSIAALATQFQRLVADGQCGLGLGLLGAQSHTVPAIGSRNDVPPFELQDGFL